MPENKEQSKREKVFDYISDNSSKEDFIKWLLNNIEATVSQDSSWAELKKEVLKDKDISYSTLRDYAITLSEDSEREDALEAIKKETEKAEEVAEELIFLGKLEKFSIAIGGIILFLGLISLTLGVLWIIRPDLFAISNDPTIHTLVTIFLGLSGLVEVVGGLLLMAK